jgi:nucleotide-binding universal stress UspA family protein
MHMAYKTIMVCLNEISRVPQLIEAARSLGTKLDAHITGLYVIPGVEVYPATDYAAGASFYDGNRLFYQGKLPKIRAEFEDAMKKDGLSFDFKEIDSVFPRIAQDVLEEGRAVDLIVASATNREAVTGVESDLIERLVIAAGHPILVLPAKGNAFPKLEEVILAWDGSREAARSAFDAVPLLKLASRTQVLTVDPNGRGSVPGAAIAEALDRHGIKAKTLTVNSDGQGIGEAVLRSARDQGANLIVMGAYGHSRFAEFVFGGTTRHMIRNLDRPVLMSH